MERVSAHCCCIPYTVIKIFSTNTTRRVQGHPRSTVMVLIESPWAVSYLTSFESNIVSLTVFEIFEYNCNDLHLGRFKVIQGQRSWCQSIAHRWFPIRLPLTPLSYLSPFSKYFTCNFNDLELGGVKVNGNGANRKPMGGFLSDLLWVQHRISHRFRDIWV